MAKLGRGSGIDYITSTYLETLNESMPWQMKEVIATGGGHTKYKLVDHHLIVTILVIKSTFCQGGAIFLAKIVYPSV